MKLSLILCAAVLLACGKKDKDADLGQSLGNALVLGMAQDQYKKAKATYDSGGDATLDCIIDTSELRKDKSADAQKLATDLDTLCDVDVPARKIQKDLDDKLKDVEASKKNNDGMLEANQVLLKISCDDADKAIKDIGTKNLSSSPNAKALSDKHQTTGTTDNLEGKAKKTAKR